MDFTQHWQTATCQFPIESLIFLATRYSSPWLLAFDCLFSDWTSDFLSLSVCYFLLFSSVVPVSFVTMIIRSIIIAHLHIQRHKYLLAIFVLYS
jgi:hypothetical protein